MSIYLTDDSCTDGTGYAVRDNFSDKNITILKGTGNLYWAGGMRFAWNEALKKHNDWDFYLLLNDDTDLLDNLFEELLNIHKYCIENYKQSGIYSGITSSKSDHNKMTYGGDVWKNKFLGTSMRLNPIGKPQLCDITNANILLVSKEVVDEIGIFWKGYTHGRADNDYSNLARIFNGNKLDSFVELTGPMQYTDCLDFIASCDLSVIIEAQCEEGIYLPTKFVDAVQCRIPVFCVSPKVGTLHDLIEQYHNGYFSDNTSVESIKQALKQAINDYRNNNLPIISKSNMEYFFEESIINKFNSIFSN